MCPSRSRQQSVRVAWASTTISRLSSISPIDTARSACSIASSYRWTVAVVRARSALGFGTQCRGLVGHDLQRQAAGLHGIVVCVGVVEGVAEGDEQAAPARDVGLGQLGEVLAEEFGRLAQVARGDERFNGVDQQVDDVEAVGGGIDEGEGTSVVAGGLVVAADADGVVTGTETRGEGGGAITSGLGVQRHLAGRARCAGPGERGQERLVQAAALAG